MDFRRKLERLKIPGPAPIETGAPERPALSNHTETLDALRRQMAEVLGRKGPAVSPAPPELSIRELPFALEETAAGPVHRRVLRLSPSHHVGRMPLDAARGARAEVLALLALEPMLAGADPSRALFVDTETTGLGGGAGTIAFLVGLAAFEGETLVLEQFLLRTPAEERPLLEAVARRFDAASLVITFNGKAFDVPLLAGRCVMNRLPRLSERPHLDLLHVARRLHRARIRSCTLKALESEVLGFVRDADIDGGDVAPRYFHYLRTGDELPLRTVVDHNAWDVVSMAALVGLYGEPLGVLHRDDLVSLARTYRRAKALDEAELAAEAAVSSGSGPEALRVRGEIAKARGDRARALENFEALAGMASDPSVRLELAKLYEHFVKEPMRALSMLELGTAEAPEAIERRRKRLEGKIAAQRSARRDRAQNR